MKVTIAICTWNREAQLRHCLNGMTRLEIPSGLSWEILIVNNNCTDGTEATVHSFREVLPVRQIREPRQGLSYARNAAVLAARGEYIIWTDDDIITDTQWLKGYVDATNRWPNSVLFGGPISVDFEGRPPAWLIDVWPKVCSFYSARELGNETFKLNVSEPSRLPFGGNYAVRRAEHQNYLYDVALGMKGDIILGGEELSVIKRMLSAGYDGRWVPDARVRHLIPVRRQTVRYLRQRFSGFGMEQTLQDGREYSHQKLGVPGWIWLKVLKTWCRYQYSRRTASPDRWIDDLMEYGFALGAFFVFADRSVVLRHLFK